MSFISKPLREKMCLFTAQNNSSAALIRIQTPSFLIYHGPNIDLVSEKDLRSMEKMLKGRPFNVLIELCLFSLGFCFTFPIKTATTLSAVEIICVAH